MNTDTSIKTVIFAQGEKIIVTDPKQAKELEELALMLIVNNGSLPIKKELSA